MPKRFFRTSTPLQISYNRPGKGTLKNKAALTVVIPCTRHPSSDAPMTRHVQNVDHMAYPLVADMPKRM